MPSAISGFNSPKISETPLSMLITYRYPYDVTALFTNVPAHETITIFLEKAFSDSWFNDTYDLNQEPTTLPKPKTSLVNCSSNGTLYKQVEGVAMGSPLEPLLANTFMCSIARGGGGYLTKFNTGRLRPKVQPLTLLYTILAEKITLLYTFYWKKVPFYLLTSCSQFHIVLNK